MFHLFQFRKGYTYPWKCFGPAKVLNRKNEKQNRLTSEGDPKEIHERCSIW